MNARSPSQSLWRTAGLTAAAVLLAGCTNKPTPVVTTEDVTQTRTVVSTRSVTPIDLAPPTTVAPLPPDGKPAKGEVEKKCPYIPSDNVADIIGSHVYRTTVLTTTKPQGCRFYFYAPPYQAIADIVPRTFATAGDAYNAMVQTAGQGTQAIPKKNLAEGVDGVLFRTRFFGDDGARDWACAFANGKTLVVVHTEQDDVSFNALQLAQAVVGEFSP